MFLNTEIRSKRQNELIASRYNRTDRRVFTKSKNTVFTDKADTVRKRLLYNETRYNS